MTSIIIIGLGPIGLAVAQAVSQSPDFMLAGLVDVEAGKAGKSLKDFGLNVDKSPQVVGSLEKTGRANVAIVCTTSRFDLIAPILRDCLKRGLHVTSSCEEMAWPAYRHATLASEIDALAKSSGRCLVGTGVNPGFVMDLLAVQMSSMLTKVTGVKCLRRVDALTRRLPLQEKIGSTMSVDRFNELKSKDQIGHKGLAESIAMIAHGLGRKVESGSVDETLVPVIAREPIQCGLGLIQAGQVRGMHNRGTWSGQGLSIELDLLMACAEPNPRDEIELDGPVPLKLMIPGSTPGDSATVSALINTARVLHRIEPGLKTMLDLPVAGAR